MIFFKNLKKDGIVSAIKEDFSQTSPNLKMLLATASFFPMTALGWAGINYTHLQNYHNPGSETEICELARHDLSAKVQVSGSDNVLVVASYPVFKTIAIGADAGALVYEKINCR